MAYGDNDVLALAELRHPGLAYVLLPLLDQEGPIVLLLLGVDGREPVPGDHVGVLRRGICRLQLGQVCQDPLGVLGVAAVIPQELPQVDLFVLFLVVALLLGGGLDDLVGGDGRQLVLAVDVVEVLLRQALRLPAPRVDRAGVLLRRRPRLLLRRLLPRVKLLADVFYVLRRKLHHIVPGVRFLEFDGDPSLVGLGELLESLENPEGLDLLRLFLLYNGK